MTTQKQAEALLKELLKNYERPEDLLGENGLLKKLSKQAMELALEAEMEHHLGYAKGDVSGKGSGNSRNGKSTKIVKGSSGEFDLSVPQDRNGEFEPQLIKKGQRRLSGLDERLIALYASGMTTRDIQQHMQDQYDVEVSPALISKVTDAVLSDAQAWQSRPLDSVYPIVYLDA